MSIKAAIFDFDGTLFDSMHIWDKLASQYLLNRGVIPEDDIDITYKSLSLREACEYFKVNYGFTDSVEELMQDVNNTIAHLYDHVLPKDGVPEFLANLKSRGIKIAVATATDKYLVEPVIARFGLDKFIDRVFTCTEVGVGKQSPKIYDTAAEFLNSDRNSSIIFEDALYAVKTAKKFGYKVVGIADKTERYPEKMKELCDFYLTSFRNAEEIFNV